MDGFARNAQRHAGFSDNLGELKFDQRLCDQKQKKNVEIPTDLLP